MEPDLVSADLSQRGKRPTAAVSYRIVWELDPKIGFYLLDAFLRLLPGSFDLRHPGGNKRLYAYSTCKTPGIADKCVSFSRVTSRSLLT